jgi:hypothetical protein
MIKNERGRIIEKANGTTRADSLHDPQSRCDKAWPRPCGEQLST